MGYKYIGSSCSCKRAVKHLEHGMKEVERVLGKRLCGIVSVDDVMPERNN